MYFGTETGAWTLDCCRYDFEPRDRRDSAAHDIVAVTGVDLPDLCGIAFGDAVVGGQTVVSCSTSESCV
ncbi:MAG: hypothetical protein HFH76_11025 [Lachnospiraceae bacterium]|nr:hypothetical protein [Lachnospiraceae bacterium]